MFTLTIKQSVMNAYKKTTVAQLVITFIFAIVCLSWQMPVANELANTKWKGTVFAPNPIESVFDFKNDTLKVSSGNQIIETMSFQTKGDTLVIKKLSGGSPCSGQVGRYKYAIKSNVLTLAVIQDACEVRPSSFSSDGYKKQ